MSVPENNICSSAVVKEIHSDSVVVEMVIDSACSQCHAKGFCLPSGQRKEQITVPSMEANQFSIGELVSLEMHKSLGRKAVMIAYFFPFLVLAAGLLITYKLTHHDLLSVGVSLALTAIYFYIVYRFRDKLETQFTFSIKKKEVY